MPSERPLLPTEPAGPAWLIRSAALASRVLVLGLVVWLAAEFATKLTLLLAALLIALLLAGTFIPVVHWGERRGVPRGVSAGAVVAVLLLLVGGTLAVVGVRVADEMSELGGELRSGAEELSRTLGVDVPVPNGGGNAGQGGGDSGQDDGAGEDSEGQGADDREGSEAEDAGEQAGGSDPGGGGSGGLGGLESVRAVADVLVGFFLTLAFTFLFLKSGRSMWQWLLEKLGGRLREDVDAAGNAAWQTVGAYMRGLTIVALFDAVGVGIGLVLLGVPLALTLAVLQFVGSYVPTIGAFVAGAVAVAFAYVDGGIGTAVAVLVLVVVVQQLGNSVIEPYVMQRGLPLNALMVLVAVTAGGLLWGIAGALLFVPLAAAVSAAGHELWQRRGEPPLIGGEAET